jgi:hypothetical protein
MNRSHLLPWIAGPLAVLGLACIGSSQEVPPPKGEMLPTNPIEVQTRGPLHEAVAQPFDPTPGTPIPKQPPAPINEQPPDQMPDTENSQWLPGYWAWDPERQEFLWVSGVYRTPPQGRTFVPGYWAHSSDGWRWVAGFWSDARQQEIPYAPEPPAPLNVGPSTPPPDDNSIYVPGVWVYNDGRFLWRPGYWSAMQTGRVWVPPHYSWTPAGYAYVDGYWDYPLEDRGLIFAPVRFNQPLAPNAVYQPDYVVNYPSFLDSGYYLPGSGQYWFGNYSAPYYGGLGYQPWYNGAGRYNPAFANYGWQNGRNNPNWLSGVQRTYAGRTNGTIAGPPLTLAQQTPRNSVVMPLSQFKNNQLRLTATTPTVRASAQQTRQLAQVRSQADASLLAKGTRLTQTATRVAPPVVTSQHSAPTKGITANASRPIITNGARINAAPIRATPTVTTPRGTAPHIVNAPPSNQARAVHAPAPTVHHAAAPAHHAPSGGHAASAAHHASSGGHAAGSAHHK